MEDLADERGLMLIGCYHSHPDSPALPSDFDKEHSLPNFLYIIVSVRAGAAADMRAWELERGGTDEREIGELSDREWQSYMV